MFVAGKEGYSGHPVVNLISSNYRQALRSILITPHQYSEGHIQRRQFDKFSARVCQNKTIPNLQLLG